MARNPVPLPLIVLCVIFVDTDAWFFGQDADPRFGNNMNFGNHGGISYGPGGPFGFRGPMSLGGQNRYYGIRKGFGDQGPISLGGQARYGLRGQGGVGFGANGPLSKGGEARYGLGGEGFYGIKRRPFGQLGPKYFAPRRGIPFRRHFPVRTGGRRRFVPRYRRLGSFPLPRRRVPGMQGRPLRQRPSSTWPFGARLQHRAPFGPNVHRNFSPLARRQLYARRRNFRVGGRRNVNLQRPGRFNGAGLTNFLRGPSGSISPGGAAGNGGQALPSGGPARRRPGPPGIGVSVGAGGRPQVSVGMGGNKQCGPMCLMYCSSGFQKDSNGCPICKCKSKDTSSHVAGKNAVNGAMNPVGGASRGGNGAISGKGKASTDSNIELTTLHTTATSSGLFTIGGAFSDDLFRGTCPKGTKPIVNHRCRVTNAHLFLHWLSLHALEYGIKYSYRPIQQ